MGNLVHTNQPLSARTSKSKHAWPACSRAPCLDASRRDVSHAAAAAVCAAAIPRRRSKSSFLHRRRRRHPRSPARPSGAVIAVGGFFVTQKCLY